MAEMRARWVGSGPCPDLSVTHLCDASLQGSRLHHPHFPWERGSTVNTSPAAPPRTGKLQPSEGKVRQPCCKPGSLDRDFHLLSYLAGQVLLCSGSSMRHTANCVSSWQALQELSLQAPPLFIPSVPPQGLCTCSSLCRKPRGLAGSQQSELSSQKEAYPLTPFELSAPNTLLSPVFSS